ncbi:hypothetical protein D3C80_2101490 [compost metagenome]
MVISIDAELPQALQIQLLDIIRRWLQNDLKLMMLVQTVRVLPITSVRRTAGRLHVSHIPWLRSD